MIEKNNRFKDKILAKLGNVEDSKENSVYDENQLDDNFADGLDEPSDMDLGDADLDAMRAADAAGELDGGYQYGTDTLNGSPDQRQSNQYQAQ